MDSFFFQKDLIPKAFSNDSSYAQCIQPTLELYQQ